LVAKALSLAERPEDKDLRTELEFYRYAHGDRELRAAALRSLRELIEGGVRSPGWDLSSNIERAIEEGHPSPAFLRALADVIAAGGDTSTLDAFREWADG
jgi:hypothetical protein